MTLYIIEGKKDGKKWASLSGVIQTEHGKFYVATTHHQTVFQDKQEAIVQLKRLRIDNETKLRIREWVRK